MTSVFSKVVRGLSLLATAGGLAACSNSAASTGYTPPTGIQILASSIVAGRGCGVSTNQVFKYVAVVSPTTLTDGGIDGPPVASGVFDCFVDGFFSNLVGPDGSSPNFSIAVFAYNMQSFPTDLNCPPDGGLASVPCPGDAPVTALSFSGAANWTTTCTATQVQGGTSPAKCDPLQPTGVGPTDAGAADGASEADPNGEAGGSAEATEGGTSETGADEAEAAADQDASTD